MQVTLVAGNGNTYLTISAGYKNFQEQGKYTEIATLNIEDRVETIQKMVIKYRILDSVLMADTTVVLFVYHKIVISETSFCLRKLWTKPRWSNICSHVLPPELLTGIVDCTRYSQQYQ